jgi:flagellar biosynthesis/type III secretory pathway chaperone
MYTDSKKLEELLLKQLRHLKALSDSAELKKFAIINNKSEELEQIAQSESFIIAQIKEIEDSKQSLLSEMATDEFPLQKMNLVEVAKCFAKEGADRILKLQKAVKTVTNEVNVRNKRNAELLNFAIQHFNSFFQLIFEHQNPPNVYTPKGLQNKEVTSGNMFLDKRA